MVVSKPSREQPPIEMHRVRETQRALGILREDTCLRKKVHKIFDLGHIINYGIYRDKIRVIYPNLDLSCPPPLEKNTNEFLIEICAASLKASAN